MSPARGPYGSWPPAADCQGEAAPKSRLGLIATQSALKLRLALLSALVVAAACLLVVPCAGAQARIAFVRSSHIWTVNPDGSGLKRLTSGAASGMGPAWSRGRGTIAFLRLPGKASNMRRSLWLMRSDGSNQRRLAYSGPSLSSGSTALAFSPDGRQLAGACTLGVWRYGVTVLDLATRRSRIVGRISCQGGIVSLTWSPHGAQLVAVAEFGDGVGMFRFDAVSGGLLQTYHDYAVESVSWSPDGDRLLCQVWRSDLPGYPTWTMLFKPDGTRVRTLGKQQSDPAYSPDGKRYAFVATPDNSPDGVYIADADGTNVRKVCGGTGLWQLAWK